MGHDALYRVNRIDFAYMNDQGEYDWNMAVDARAFYDAFQRFMATNQLTRAD